MTVIKNKEQKKAYHHKYYLEHLERIKANRRKHREQKKIYDTEYRRQLKTKVLSHYSGGDTPACIHCGVRDMRILSIDHIDGSGAEHRRLVSSGTGFYHWLVRNNYPEGYQTLCMNCQFIKRFS